MNPHYASVIDLTERVAYSELAEAAAPDAPAVDGELLKLKLDDADLSAFSDADRSAVSVAVKRLERVLDDASADVDSYIGKRYGVLATPPPVLTVRCLDIALYRLFGGDAQSEYYLIYKRSVEWLVAVAAGKIDLGVVLDSEVIESGIQINAGERVFDNQSLKNY